MPNPSELERQDQERKVNAAPWSDDQVASLNAFQAAGVLHPFTCGGERCRAVLMAEADGWHCPAGCGYKQTWAHPFMADWSWKKFVPPWEKQS
jgi:hypothetical protein